jgi:hypothetical protein
MFDLFERHFQRWAVAYDLFNPRGDESRSQLLSIGEVSIATSYYSGFSPNRCSPLIHARMYAGEFLSWMPSASQPLRKLTTS